MDAPRLVDADFEEFIDTVEAVLEVVLERFETHFHQVVHRLDVLLAKTTPYNGDADGLRQNFPHNQVISHYFFSRASAAWLGPVHHAGFFAARPPAEVDEDAGTVQIPTWPVSDYLVRVGPETPSAAVDAALAIPSTDNSRVHHDIVRLALAIPAEQGVRLVRTIIEGLGGRFGPLIPHEVGAVVAHRARNGQIEHALQLAAALLNRMPPRTAANWLPAYQVRASAAGALGRGNGVDAKDGTTKSHCQVHEHTSEEARATALDGFAGRCGGAAHSLAQSA